MVRGPWVLQFPFIPSACSRRVCFRWTFTGRPEKETAWAVGKLTCSGLGRLQEPEIPGTRRVQGAFLGDVGFGEV